MAHKTREAWLLDATDRMRVRMFAPIGETLPIVKVSVGFPGGGSARKAIGEHWNPKATADGISQVFISPVLSDPVAALETLAHELVHAIYPDDGHKKGFARVARAIGLVGPLTKTTAGPDLKERLTRLAAQLGEYPHAGIDLGTRKKQSTRLIKLVCKTCGYTVRTTERWITVALPDCRNPCHPPLGMTRAD